MLVEVRLFAALREGRFKKKELELVEGDSPYDVLGVLGIPLEEVGILLVNGANASTERKLAGQDVLSIFPSLGGG